MPIKFRFRWIPFIAAAVAIIIGVSLGQWQMRRAAEKEVIEARYSARESGPPFRLGGTLQPIDPIEYRHVVVMGAFVPNWTIYLDNRPYNGAAGFYVLTPLQIAGSDMYVLVARGWVPRDRADRTRLPALPAPDGEVVIEGIAQQNIGHLLQLGQAEALHPNAIVQNVDVKQFEAASKLMLQPFFIEQQNDMQDKLVRDWPRPSSGIDRHHGYAFQWYGLAATAFLFFVVTGFRRGTREATK